MNKAILVAAFLAIGLTGCESATLVRDASSEDAQDNSLGFYTLPKAALGVDLYYGFVISSNGETGEKKREWLSSDGFLVAAATPRIEAGEAVPIAAIFSASSADKFTVDVDPATGFLKSIELNIQDKAVDTIKAAAASIGAVAAFFPNFGVPGAAPLQAKPTAEAGRGAVMRRLEYALVASVVVDPTDAVSLADANALLNAQAREYVAHLKGGCRPGRSLRCDKRATWRASRFALPEGATVPATDHAFISSRFAVAKAAAHTPAPRSVCAASTMKGPGVCVRVARNVPVMLQAPGGPPIWQDARLPVAGDDYLLNVERAMFANKVFKVDFVDGFAGKREVNQSSQTLAIAGAPKAAIDAFIDSLSKTTTALSNLIPVRVKYESQRHPTTTTSTTSRETKAEPAQNGEPSTTQETTTTTTQETTSPEPDGGSPAPPPDKPKPEDAGGPGTAAPAAPAPKPPSLWFAACSYGLDCAGPLEQEIATGRTKTSKADTTLDDPSATVPAVDVIKDCARPENLDKPQCKGGSVP